MAKKRKPSVKELAAAWKRELPKKAGKAVNKADAKHKGKKKKSLSQVKQDWLKSLTPAQRAALAKKGNKKKGGAPQSEKSAASTAMPKKKRSKGLWGDTLRNLRGARKAYGDPASRKKKKKGRK